MTDAKQTTAPAASGVVDTVRNLPPWALVLAVIGVVLWILAIVLLLRRRTPKPAGAGGASLSSIWNRYLDRLGTNAPAARFYPVVVVLAGPEVDTKHLVGRTDWEALAQQGILSEPGDGRLPHYAGRGVLVQDVSWPVLKDTGDGADQLADLWKEPDRPPVVLVAVDATRLAPSDLLDVANAVRGKLDVLAKARRMAVPVRVCLTGMERIGGYAEVAALGIGGAPLRLAPGAPVDAAAIARSFDPLGAALPRALVERQPPDLRRAVKFFTSAVPGLAADLAPFLQTLTRPGDSPFTPSIEGIYLDGASGNVGDPFAVDAGAAAVALAARRRRLITTGALVAGGITLASTIVTAGLYLHHRGQVEAASAAVDALVRDSLAAPSGDLRAARRIEDDERAAGDLLQAVASADALWIYRGTFAAEKARVRGRFLDTVRDVYAIPATRAPGGRVHALYAVALVYAAASNEIGQTLIPPSVSTWASQLGLPEAVVRDYAALSPATWDGKTWDGKPWNGRSGDAVVPRGPAGPASEAASVSDWSAYLGRLSAVFATARPGSIAAALAPDDLTALKAENARFLAVLDEAVGYADVRSLADAVKRVAPVDPAAIDRLLIQGDVPAWVNDNRTALSALLGLVRDGTVDATPPPARFTLLDLFAALAAQQAPAIADATYDFQLQQQRFSFRSADWIEVLLRARAHVLAKPFLDPRAASDGQSYAFFVDAAIYAPIGAAAVRGKGPAEPLRGIFTQDAFKAEVAPVFDAAATQLNRVHLAGPDRGRLKAFLENETDRYAAAYRNALSAYYASFQLVASSPAVLRAMIAELSLPSSWLSDFLATVSRNAGLDLKDGDLYQRMGSALESYKPIVALMTEQKGSYPNLEKYVSFLAPLLAPAPSSGDKGPGLADRLSPTGRSALSMLRGDKDSVYLQVEPWLTASGIGAGQSAPFLAPVDLSYGFGVDEMTQVIGQSWQKEALPDVLRLTGQFPFNRSAGQDAAIADVEGLFLPEKGRFWQWFSAMLQPVCAQIGGRWAPWTTSRRSPVLPRGVLTTVNDAAAMGAQLWDKSGKAQPVSFDVRSRPLPTPDADSAPTMATLRTGKASFFGFNQMATWQRLDLVWGDEGASALELEVSSPDSDRKRYLHLEVSDSTWSFYRLLAQSSAPYATWTLTDAPLRNKQVAFELRGDPWAPFRIRVSQ